MPNPFCEPYQPCEHLKGRLSVAQGYHGRHFGQTLDRLQIGHLVASRTHLRPYVRTWFTQEWVPKEACYGPVNEVLSLAPGEILKKSFRSVHQHDFTRIVQDAVESSTVTARTDYIEKEDQPTLVELLVKTIDRWGSWFEVLGGVAGAALGGPLGAALGVWAGDAIGGLLGGNGGGGGAANGTLDDIDAVVDVVETQQTRHLTETIESTTTITERVTERTLQNPYRDRSLQLRMIPTFRRYEVITTWTRFEWGVTLDLGSMIFAKTGNGIRYGDFLQQRLLDPRIGAVANAELGIDDDLVEGPRSGAVGEHLNANAEAYSKRWLGYLERQKNWETLGAPVNNAIGQLASNARDATKLSTALGWSQAYTRSKSIYVPMRDTATALSALALPERALEGLKSRLDVLKPVTLAKFTTKRNVHLFLGTHIEAAPGDCVLPGVPPAPGLPPDA